MRKQARSALVASATLMILAMSPSWADDIDDYDTHHGWMTRHGEGYSDEPRQNPNAPGQNKKEPYSTPEINIGASGTALALLASGLLLAAEKRKRSRSS